MAGKGDGQTSPGVVHPALLVGSAGRVLHFMITASPGVVHPALLVGT